MALVKRYRTPIPCFVLTLLADIDAAGNWRPGLGDNTLYGWGITLAYLGAVVLCVWAWGSEDERWLRGVRGIRPRFWLAMAAALLLLGVNKQLDLQTLVSVVGRRAAKSMGWYDQRRAVQGVFIGAVALVAIGAVAGIGWWIRAAWRRYWLAAVGAAYLAFFIVLRAASFHHVDEFLYRTHSLGGNVNRLLEASGITLIALSAIITAVSEPRSARPRKGRG
jgi:hypothetical protein